MNIEIERIKWKDEVGTLLATTNLAVPVNAVQERCAQDLLWIYEVFFDKLSIGYFLTRDETLFDGTKQLVITHCVTKVKGKTPLASILGLIIPNLARERGYSSVRIHSERRGMDHIIEQQGGVFFESVFTIKVEPHV